MKRFATTIAVGTIALAVSAGSASAATSYSGPTEAGGTISFIRDGNKLKKFQFQSIPLNCKKTDGATTSDGLSYNEKIKNGKFKVRAVDEANNGSINARLRVKGKIVGGNASGTFQLEGNKVRIDQGGREKCRSGKLDWNAFSVTRAEVAPDKAYSRR